ncbi:alpha-glucosidase [Alkalihalobacillus trypoxylicola]|uniref:Alpha-amylase n=1 Tax=Alkalihalobacillus trypoxylicola TaxID=519424 RepID=A0A162DDT0_9BACI|nr:alpha-glucosidase [Alkalihalobacillus trypoxylicola]KYG29310.1 glucohydrolase [Alkalihalobacillus trypoxylicola]
MLKNWWKEAVAYQIYPRSFKDSNGDGIGDLQGIIEKLEYIQDLGVEVIWICPMYRSPNDDNGYDISDYQEIMEDFGTMADFDQLLNEVHARGMKLIIDLVINHTSDEHSWFVESKSSKDNPKRDWYIWADPAADGSEPNNWESIFNGSAWQYDPNTKQYFMHVFSKKQPDLNWENSEVRSALYKMMNWWLDKGIDGFRVDAISHIKKVKGFPDLPNPKQLDYVPSFEGHMNQEGIHLFLQELKKETFDHYDIMTVGEANGVSVEQSDLWVDQDKGAFNMIFQFEHLGLWEKETGEDFNLIQLKKILSKWQNGLQGFGWNALFLENHDQTRSVSAWGDDQEYWQESAKALATMYFFMQGTPFIYQGQEIGMTNVKFPHIEDYNDVGMLNYYEIEIAKGKSHQEVMEVIWQKGRDNSRTPMQWNSKSLAGFTDASKSWMKVNPNYKEINVDQQLSDPHSILSYYKKMIAIRKENEGLIYGEYNLILNDHQQVFGYTRKWKGECYLILVNMFGRAANFSFPIGADAKLLLSNVDTVNHLTTLSPFEARVYKIS